MAGAEGICLEEEEKMKKRDGGKRWEEKIMRVFNHTVKKWKILSM